MLPDLPQAELIELFRVMLTMRRFEEALILATKSGVSVGHFHVYIGQECTGAPALALLGREDTIFTTHRNHGHVLGRGADPGRVLAEIMGRATGYNGGKGGTLHVTARELGVLPTSAVVGGVVPLATGAAFAAKQRGSDAVCVCFFGDGVLEEGAFYEAINIASLWNLPVVYLCENNSEGAIAGEFPGSTIAARPLTDLPAAFRIPAQAVDGADAGEVHGAVKKALRRARAGEGPSFIEARTVRWPGSRPLWPDLLTGETDLGFAWEPARIPQSHGEWHRSQDGLLRFTRELAQDGRMTRDKILALDAAVRAKMQEAVRFAVESPYPQPESALAGVFAR